MGARGRAGSKIAAKKIKTELKAASKLFSRAMADRALSLGADPSEERFTKHTNKHIKDRAAKLIAKAAGGNETEEVPVVSEEVASDAS